MKKITLLVWRKGHAPQHPMPPAILQSIMEVFTHLKAFFTPALKEFTIAA